MANSTRSSKGIIGIIVIAILVFYLIKMDGCCTGCDTPSIEKPFIANLTAHYGGDQSKPYEVSVYINNDKQGVITKTYEGKEYSRRFVYRTRVNNEEMISIVFQAQIYGSDQLPAGEWYTLSVYKGNKAVLAWYQRTAVGTWEFINE